MPEGDTLRRLAARTADRFLGQTVESSVFRHPRLATLDFTGRTLGSVDAVGKNLLCRFDDGRTLRVHLLMQGRVHFRPQREVPEWRRRFEIRFAGGVMTGVDIPLLHVLDQRGERELIDNLGPDLCGVYDHDLAIERLASATPAPISAAMLNQKLIAGYGNIYAVETPFICGINPYTPVGQIESIDPLVSVGAALIRTNAALGPQNTTGRRLNESMHWVLSGGNRTCPVCRTRLQRQKGSQTPWKRRTAWCPGCQPLSATSIDPDRVRKLLALHPALRLLDSSLRLTADTSQRVDVRLSR